MTIACKFIYQIKGNVIYQNTKTEPDAQRDTQTHTLQGIVRIKGNKHHFSCIFYF